MLRKKPQRGWPCAGKPVITESALRLVVILTGVLPNAVPSTVIGRVGSVSIIIWRARKR